MRKGRKSIGTEQARRNAPAPIPLAPVDLLVGLAPGVELEADDVPPGIADTASTGQATPAVMTVAEAGKLVRAGEGTIRRLVRNGMIAPGGTKQQRGDVQRAGVLPRTRDKPGE